MSCFLFAADRPPPVPLPSPLSASCQAEFAFQSRTLERDYMGLQHSCVKSEFTTNQSPFIHKSLIACPPPLDSALSGSHLKLSPPSSGSCDIDVTNTDKGEPLSVNIGWPPISSYRRSTTKALVSENLPCSIETITPLIVHEAPLLDTEEVILNHNNGVVDDDETDDDGKHKASTILLMNNIKASILRKPLHIKVSMDGTPIMRKVDLDAMQGYQHLSLELHKLFKFHKKHLSCEVGVHSCFKDSNGATFILTYRDRDGDWMLVGDTTWKTFVQSARRIRIMKYVK